MLGNFLFALIVVACLVFLTIMAMRSHIEIEKHRNIYISDVVKEIIKKDSEIELLDNLKKYLDDLEPQDYPKESPNMMESYFDGFYEMKMHTISIINRTIHEIKAQKERMK